MAQPARPMTRSFRKRMLRSAALVFAGLAAVLLILVGTLDRKLFEIVALALIPTAAIAFNLLQRRAYAAYQEDLKR
jgi:hypothetical protein